MVDYWLAGLFGRIWLRLHRSLRPVLGELTAECALVARGERLTAAHLWKVQNFAVAVWWRTAMVLLLLCPVAVPEIALFPGRVGTDVGVSFVAGLTGLVAIALAQMGFIRYRSQRNRLYLLRSGGQANDQPLPAGSPGLPRRSDFWITLVIALSCYGIMLHAGLLSSRH